MASLTVQSDAGYDPEREILSLSEQTHRILQVAQVMMQSARPVDLEGLQGQVGLLCAKALDLPPEQTGFAKWELRRLIQGIDVLNDLMRSHSA